MSKVTAQIVAAEDDGIRLDRWFKRHYPSIPHGQIAKLIRTGQVRLDGARVKANTRIAEGQSVRVPPVISQSSGEGNERRPVHPEDAAFVQSLVMHADKHILVLNKPAGLAVQGGSKTHRHLDGMLEALRFDAKDRPKLVHRLDRDTSGVLLLARSANAAAKLTKAFRDKQTRKIYWGLVAGVPRPDKGLIDLALLKEKGRGGQDFKERTVPAPPGHPDAKKAQTYYAVVARAGQRLSWVAMMPITGRTHQLRVHMNAIGHPLIGDFKYGGEASDIAITGEGAPMLNLHARSLEIAHPGGGHFQISAPLPEHMAASWQALEFDVHADGDPFQDLEL